MAFATPSCCRPSASIRRPGSFWGLHAAHLGLRFYGTDSTITHCRGTFSLRPTAFLLRIKMMEKASGICRLRHSICAVASGAGDMHMRFAPTETCVVFCPEKEKAWQCKKDPGNDDEISLILQGNCLDRWFIIYTLIVVHLVVCTSNSRYESPDDRRREYS